MLSPRTPFDVLSRVAVALAATLALGGAAACTPIEEQVDTAPANPATKQMLGELSVARAGSMRGYSRDHFPHWRDAGENCDVRDTVLGRDGSEIKLSGCNVVGGRWVSVYDGKTFSDPQDIDIDHMVPLANAWRSGADAWDDKQRGEFANDLTRPQLIAVSASSNRAKGDQDPSQWKPAERSFWCQYAQDWIVVKHYWKLSVTSAERDALTDMLEECTWETAP